MSKYFLIYSVLLNIVWSEPFFHLAEKPIFFCFKVCPLYCSQRRSDEEKPIFFCFKVCPLYCSQRRSDEDAASLIYLEDNPYSVGPDVWIDDDPTFIPYPHHYGHYIFCKPKPTPPPTTTTMATTTAEPTFICMVCKKKCNYPKS